MDEQSYLPDAIAIVAQRYRPSQLLRHFTGTGQFIGIIRNSSGGYELGIERNGQWDTEHFYDVQEMFDYIVEMTIPPNF